LSRKTNEYFIEYDKEVSGIIGNGNIKSKISNIDDFTSPNGKGK